MGATSRRMTRRIAGRRRRSREGEREAFGGSRGFGSCAREAMETIGAPKGRPPTRSILKTRARRREPPWTLSDFRSRPELDDMTGISRPSRPPERPIVAIHGTFSGLAEIAGKRLSRVRPGRARCGARRPVDDDMGVEQWHVVHRTVRGRISIGPRALTPARPARVRRPGS